MSAVALVTSPKTPPRHRYRAGRPQKGALTPELEHVIEMAKTKDPSALSSWLQRKLNSHLDEELEVLATHVLAGADFDEVLTLPEVLGPLGRGERELALSNMLSRLRRKFAKLLRDHQRGETDDFLDECVVEE